MQTPKYTVTLISDLNQPSNADTKLHSYSDLLSQTYNKGLRNAVVAP